MQGNTSFDEILAYGQAIRRGNESIPDVPETE